MSAKAAAIAASQVGYRFRGGSSGGRALAWRLAARWEILAARARSRRALASLDRRLLDDVGLTPRQAAGEAAKPRWEV